MPVLPRATRQRLAESAAARIERLSDSRLETFFGDQVENLADELARQQGVPFDKALRAVGKALRRARLDRLGTRPSRSGTPPALSLVLDYKAQAYLKRKAAKYGSRAAVVKAALALLMRSDP